MKSKINKYLTLLLVMFVHFAFAQQRTVSGVVKDPTGMPIPGVSVLVKGTSNGTETDFDGKYSISAAPNQTLVFSYVGMKKQEVSASNSEVDIVLQEDAQMIEEVVVTAQGIKREKQALGYAVSEVKAADIEQRAEGDVARILNGKASGVIINQTSGVSGSATNINIRGYLSVSGSNQPLFIVDGVPFATDTNAQGDFFDGNNGSSRFLDIDPNNIESVNILKGFAAATLYGTQGRNGVILITTKGGANLKGPKKNEITINQSVFFNQIASLPDYQNTFGNGFDQSFGNFYSNWGPGFYANGLGGWNNPGTNVANDGTILHPYSRANLASVFPEYQGLRIPYAPVPNNVKDFFRTGVVSSTSLNFNGSSTDGKINYNFNYGRLEDEGFTPGNNLMRNSFAMGGRAVLSNKFTVSGTFNFTRTNFASPPVAYSNGSGVQGNGLSVFADIFYTPRNIDIQNWPYEHPITGENLSYRQNNDIMNPYWVVNNAKTSQMTNRFFGNGSLSYEVNKNMNLSYRIGFDFYNERNVQSINRGASRGPVLGEYVTYDNNNIIWDHNLVLSGMYQLTDKIGMSFQAGATSRHYTYDRQGVRSVDQIVRGVFRHFNFATQTPIQYTESQNIVGLYGQAEFDYDRNVYLTLASRNDWVSNFKQNSIFYPSVTVSWIPTKTFESLKSSGWGLDYLKVRGAYATSAGFGPSGYPVATTLNLNARYFQNNDNQVVVANSFSSVLGNPDLRPEVYSEVELGFDSKFLKNRVSFDFSYFNRTTTDLITNRPLPPSSGFTSTTTNIGKIKGYGFEADLGAHIVKNDGNGFNWNMSTNFTKYRSYVDDLGQDTDIIIMSGFTDLGNAAIAGQPFGVIIGSRIQRDANGNYMVNSQGDYIIEEGQHIIGDPNPDWIGNISNTFSYKNFNLNLLWSYTHGGDIYSQTIVSLLGRGLTTDTLDRLQTYILPGVDPSGNPNTIQINNSSYYFNNVMYGPSEMAVFDGSVIRLNEVSLGYDFPKKWLEKTPFGSISMNVSGYNLYFRAINTPKGVNFDPNIIGTGVGNGRGFDFLNGPSGRRFGFSFKATF